MQKPSSLPRVARALLQPDVTKASLYSTVLPVQLPLEGCTEHLIKIKAFAICNGELWWARDHPETLRSDKFGVPGYDFTGEVVLAPEGSPFPPGTEVFGARDAASVGVARDYAVVLQSELAHKPRHLTMEQTATIPISALTAYQALFEHAHLASDLDVTVASSKNKDKVLVVTAAAGGVGTWAIQLARLAGVGEIIAVCGPNNVEHVQGLGATTVINYHESSVPEWTSKSGRQVDIVFDMVGGDALKSPWTAIKEGGHLLCVASDPNPYKPASDQIAKNITAKFFILDCNGSQLELLSPLINKGLLEPNIDSVWQFDQFEEAYAKVATGRARGKVVVTMN